MKADACSKFPNTRLEIQGTVFHALDLFADALVTIALSVMFSPGKIQFKNIDMIFHRLLIYSITWGILITLVQVGHIVMYVVDPSNVLFWISVHPTVSKLYVITTRTSGVHCIQVPFPDSLVYDPWLVVILNSRSSWREKLDEVVIVDTSLLSFARFRSTTSMLGTSDVEAHPNPDNRQ